MQRRRHTVIDATVKPLRDRDLDKISVAEALATQPQADEPSHVVSAVDAVVHVIESTNNHILADPVPMRAVLQELGPLQFAENRKLGLAELLLPRTRRLTNSDHDADLLVSLIVYGFRGVFTSWAHGLADDDTSTREGKHLFRVPVTTHTTATK